MPYVENGFGTFQGKCDQSDENPGMLCRCPADWYNHPTSRKLILYIPPVVAGVQFGVYLTIRRVSEEHRFKNEVCLKRETC
jgi:hypothetical protein